MHMLARPPIKEANGCSSRAQTSHANNLQACRHTLGIKHTHTQTHMHTHTHVHTHTHTHTCNHFAQSGPVDPSIWKYSGQLLEQKCCRLIFQKFSAILEALSKARRNGIVTGLCSPPVSSPRWLGCGSKCPSRSAHRPNEECSCVCPWPLEVAGMTMGSR